MIKTPLSVSLPACVALLFFISCGKDVDSPAPNKAPASFEISIAELKPTSAKLTWTEATDPEGSQVTYAIMLGADTVNKTSARQYEFTTLQEDKDYEVTVVARDPQGAHSKKTITFTTTEHASPAAFDVTMASVGGSIASIQWTASQLSDGGTLKYDVYLNDQLLKSDLADTVLHFEYSDLDELTSYTAKVIAKSNFNKTKESTKSFTTVANPAPTGLTSEIKSVSYSFIKFKIGAATDAEGEAITYSVWLNGTDISSQLEATIVPGKEYAIRTLTGLTNYTLNIKATDAGGKSMNSETPVATLKQPTLVISNKSVTKTADGFVYNIETNVDYKPSQIVLVVNGVAKNIDPADATIINGNTISFSILNSQVPEGSNSLAFNIFWGDDTEKSRSATFDTYAWYDFKPTSVVVDQAMISTSTTYKTYTVTFINNIISPDKNYQIVEVVFGNTNQPHTIFRTGETTGYLTEFVANFATVVAGPKTGYVIMKDNAGFHKMDFTWGTW